MRMAAGMLFAALLSGAVHADEGMIRPGDIIDAAIGDWNRDGLDDLAILAVTQPEENMEIGVHVFLRDGERGFLKPALSVPDKVWGSRFHGHEPSIRALENGSIAITTQNSSIGREHWTHTISLAYRNGRFLVAGLTFSSHDTRQEDEELICDLNLLTGRGIINDRPTTFRPLSLTLEEWSDEGGDDPGTAICRGR